MASAKINHDGHTLEITSEMIDITSIMEQDPSWTYTDSAGHVHRYDDSAPGGPYPALVYMPHHGHADDEDGCDYDDDQDLCYPVLVCKECGQRVTPGMRAGRPRSIPGMTSYLIDGEHVSPQAAQDFMAAARAEREAAAPVCHRCRCTLYPDRGHVCADLVANRTTQTLVANIRKQGLNHVLSVLVGTDTARKMIRDAWVSLDRDDRET